MSLFKRRKREMPTLNVTSLPDLIFTVLFFFMIVTSMRSNPVRLRYNTPTGTELTKQTRKSHVIDIYVGSLADGEASNKETLIQINDRICAMTGVTDEVIRLRRAMSADDARRMCVSIRADRDTDMGTITDLKMALRRAGAYRISYSAAARPADVTPSVRKR